MGTPVTNFGKVTVSTGYAAGETSIVLTTGHGSRLPSTFPFPLVWWNATDYSDPADDPNKEIVTVTARVTDTLTVTRAAESTTATAKNTAAKTYKMVLSITKAMWEELQARALTQSHRGLRVQTDSSTAPSSASDVPRQYKVLVNADSIVMSDGEEVSSWSNVVANITASGANGLDTGAEAASTWYEIWAIYNGTTKSALLHRAKDYYLDIDFSTGEDASQGLRSAVDNSTVKIAQKFVAVTAGPVEFVDVKLLKTGTPSGNYWFTLETNNGGAPSGTVLATSDAYDASRLITTAQWVRIPFRTPASLSAAATYHLVLQGDYTVSATNYIMWRMDGSAGTYANGNKLLYDSNAGGTWTAYTDDDMMFRIYVTRNDTALTLPTGYTQYALLGYVYNDSGSNFLPFLQVGRTVFGGRSNDWAITTSFATTTSTLIDLRAIIPPREVILHTAIYNATAAHNAFGNIRATDIVSTANFNAIGSVRVYGAASEEMTVPPLGLEYAGMTAVVGGGTASLYILTFTF